MSNINLNLYNIFRVVAQSKSYSEASEKLNITIPAISIAISKLEKLLGIPLFLREKDGVKLTPKGKQLYKHVNEGLEKLDFGEKLISDKNDLESGEILIGCPSHVANFYLMEKIEKAKKDFPNLRIKLIAGASSNEMFQLLRDNTLDFIIDIYANEILGKDIVTTEIEEINNIFVSKNPIEIKNLSELESLKYILNFDYTFSSRKLMEALSKHNITIESTMECDITELRIDAVKKGLGIAYVLKDMVEKELTNKEVFEVKLPIELPKTSINLTYIKGQLTELDEKFIKKYLK